MIENRPFITCNILRGETVYSILLDFTLLYCMCTAKCNLQLVKTNNGTHHCNSKTTLNSNCKICEILVIHSIPMLIIS